MIATIGFTYKSSAHVNFPWLCEIQKAPLGRLASPHDEDLSLAPDKNEANLHKDAFKQDDSVISTVVMSFLPLWQGLAQGSLRVLSYHATILARLSFVVKWIDIISQFSDQCKTSLHPS